jgi:hypothetical protein
VRQIRIRRAGVRHERPWPEVLPLDPRDPDVVRAKALARAATQLAEWRAADCSTSRGIARSSAGMPTN